MWQCDECDLTFVSFQAKANHVRWKHKPTAYSEDGLARIRANAQASALKCYGNKTTVIEERTCPCGSKFTVTYSPERKTYVKMTCSTACAARRKQTPEMYEKKSRTMKARLQEDVDLRARYVKSLVNTDNHRCSSKVERALAAELHQHGFKRHKHVTVGDLTFDIDIVSSDGRVWVESDGEWHFRQVHPGHDFQKTQLRDRLEEDEAIRRNVLLIRVNNQTTTVREQVEFIIATSQKWDGTGKVARLGFE